MSAIPATFDPVGPVVLYANRFAANADVPWHRHEGHELVLVTKGSCEIEVGSARLSGGPGTLFVLPEGVPQYQRSGGFVRTSYVVFRDTHFDSTSRVLHLDPNGAPARWLEDVCDLATLPAADLPAAEVLSGLTRALLAHLAGRERRQQERRALAHVHPALDAALAYLETRADTPVRATEIAAQACVSPSHLTALFHQRFACGPVEYHLRQRLRRAERLLHDPYLSVAQVARACGFEDANYFVRLFKRRYGAPPGIWRQRILVASL